MQCKPSSLEVQNTVGQTLHELIAPAPPYAALIFDCDGTIADTLPVHFQTLAALCKLNRSSTGSGSSYSHCAGKSWQGANGGSLEWTAIGRGANH